MSELKVVEIGQVITARDMFGMVNFQAKVVGLINGKDFILQSDSGCLTRGQVSLQLTPDEIGDSAGSIEVSVRGTSWHNTLEELVAHWTRTKKPTAVIATKPA